ncbi:MAG TPA: sulfotransferase domain-containing protein, partial [Caulobacteraceae bacterium]|nr:sulfotransferase domain-containing protein [Caulobacteraceae bacterium]
MLIRAPEKLVRNWLCDSRHWDRYTPRPGDVVIATAPKVGTTWTQQIVSLLIFQSPAPRPIRQHTPWLDCRFQMPIDVAIGVLEAQAHQRAIMSHLPFDALPLYDQVRYVHTARGGLDACFSLHNHYAGFTPAALANIDRVGLEDETIGQPLPRPPSDQRDFFRFWIESTSGRGSAQAADFFEIERSFWRERGRENVLLVHYNDLKADLAGEMKRIAAFLGIQTPDALWPQLVEAATFDAMKRDGAELLPGLDRVFEQAHDT